MKKGLIIVDMINGIAVNGSCGNFVKKYPVLNNINQLIKLFRNQNLPCFFVRLAFSPGYPDCPKHSKTFNYIKDNQKFLVGDLDTELMKGLDFRENEDRLFNKTAANPFHHSGLSEAIHHDQVEHLIFVGVATDNAINIGSRYAHDEGYKTTIIADACGASTLEMHENALLLLNKIVNEITTTKDFIASWKDKSKS